MVDIIDMIDHAIWGAEVSGDAMTVRWDRPGENSITQPQAEQRQPQGARALGEPLPVVPFRHPDAATPCPICGWNGRVRGTLGTALTSSDPDTGLVEVELSGGPVPRRAPAVVFEWRCDPITVEVDEVDPT